MNTGLNVVISLLIGSVIVVNGIAVKIDDIMSAARQTVGAANVHQLATAVELYYSDHDRYPDVSGGKALVELLRSENYIKNPPADPGAFEYRIRQNGQDYILAVK